MRKMEETRRTLGDDIEEMKETVRQYDEIERTLLYLERNCPKVFPIITEALETARFHDEYCIPMMEFEEKRKEQERRLEEQRDAEIQEELRRVEQEEKAKARKKKKNKKRRR